MSLPPEFAPLPAESPAEPLAEVAAAPTAEPVSTPGWRGAPGRWLHRGAAKVPVLTEALRLAGEADVVDRAAALTLFCIFAAVPSLFVAFSVVGFVLGAVDEAGDFTGVDLAVRSRSLARIDEWVQASLPGITWNPAEFAAALVRDRTTNGVVGTVLAVSLGLTVFSRIDGAVRAIFGKAPRSALRAAGAMTLFVLVAALLAALLTLFAPLSEWGLTVAARGMSTLSLGWIDGWSLLLTATQTLPVAVCFYGQVRWSVHGDVGHRRLMAAALVFGLLWFLGQRVFTAYVKNVVKMDAVYGALTGVIALMMWLFYASLAFLTAVALVAAWDRHVRKLRVHATAPTAHPPETPLAPANPDRHGHG